MAEPKKLCWIAPGRIVQDDALFDALEAAGAPISDLAAGDFLPIGDPLTEALEAAGLARSLYEDSIKNGAE